MSFSKRAVLGSLLMLGVGSAFADTTDMRVTGIIAPVACTTDFFGGNVLDWGDIDPAAFGGAGESFYLPDKRISYVISCDAPVAIATSFSDGRADSGWGRFFGLGLQDGVSIGGYRIRVAPEQASADGVPVDRIYSVDGGGTWGRDVVWYTTDDTTLVAFAATGTTTPGAYQNYVGRVIVQPYLLPGRLDRMNKIDLDGLATLTVRYL